MLKKILEGRPLGHPLHPLVVHLPLGFWLMSIIFDVLRMTLPDPSGMALCSLTALILGDIFAIISAITGLNDWLDMREDHPAQTVALWHLGLNLAATALFLASTAVHWAYLTAQTQMLGFALSLVGCATVMVSGYLGGLLVYDDGIAVGRHRRRGELPQETLHEAMPDTTDVTFARDASLGEDYVPVAPFDAIDECHTLRVELRGYVVCIAKCGGTVWAFQEFCTHRCGPLSEGCILANTIECPWHKSVFDMNTGEVVDGPAKVPLKTFDVQVRMGIIHVRIPTDRQPARAGERRNPPEEPTITRDQEPTAARIKAREQGGS